MMELDGIAPAAKPLRLREGDYRHEPQQQRRTHVQLKNKHSVANAKVSDHDYKTDEVANNGGQFQLRSPNHETFDAGLQLRVGYVMCKTRLSNLHLQTSRVFSILAGITAHVGTLKQELAPCREHSDVVITGLAPDSHIHAEALQTQSF